MTPDEVEDYRRMLEARQWLRLGYDTAASIEGLRKRIEHQRGAAAAERLINEMRQQYAIRGQWMGSQS